MYGNLGLQSLRTDRSVTATGSPACHFMTIYGRVTNDVDNSPGSSTKIQALDFFDLRGEKTCCKVTRDLL